MYELIRAPSDPELEEAFGILQDTVGSEPFEESEAVSILTRVLDDANAARQLWSRFKRGEYVTEV